jgi:hypothetical protein
MEGGARVETARKRYTDSFAYRDPLKNSGHAIPIIVDGMAIRSSEPAFSLFSACFPSGSSERVEMSKSVDRTRWLSVDTPG